MLELCHPGPGVGIVKVDDRVVLLLAVFSSDEVSKQTMRSGQCAVDRESHELRPTRKSGFSSKHMLVFPSRVSPKSEEAAKRVLDAGRMERSLFGSPGITHVLCTKSVTETTTNSVRHEGNACQTLNVDLYYCQLVGARDVAQLFHGLAAAVVAHHLHLVGQKMSPGHGGEREKTDQQLQSARTTLKETNDSCDCSHRG